MRAYFFESRVTYRKDCVVIEPTAVKAWAAIRAEFGVSQRWVRQEFCCRRAELVEGEVEPPRESCWGDP